MHSLQQWNTHVIMGSCVTKCFRHLIQNEAHAHLSSRRWFWLKRRQVSVPIYDTIKVVTLTQ